MAESNTPHESGIRARRAIDMDRVRGMNFIPKTTEAWHNQYQYNSVNELGKPIPLTGEVIDDILINPIYGKTPSINIQNIKKCVILADALYLPEFMDPFLIKCQAGFFLNIFPHSYTVNCNDPLVRQTSVLKLKIGKEGRRRCIRSATIPTTLDSRYKTVIHHSTAR